MSPDSFDGVVTVRLLICTQWFDPEPTPKGLSFALALSERGFDVEVLTGFPNYPEGRVYDGFRLRPYRQETIDGVVIHRVWLYPSHDRSARHRALSYLSFATSAALAGLIKARRADIVYAYQLPTVGWMGRILASRFGAALVLDVQDLWPDTVLSSGMMKGGLTARLLDSACRGLYRRADRVVALSAGMASLLQARGVPRSRLRVIPNWVDEAQIGGPWDQVARDRARATLGKGFSILFAGQMGEAQDLENALEAAALTPSIRWAFLGAGTDRTRLGMLAQARGLRNVVFPERVPMKEVGAWLEAAGALLVHLSDDPLYASSIPSKTQAYMLAQRPILMAAAGDAAALIDASGAGVTCVPGNPQRLAVAATQLAEMSPAARSRLGTNGRTYYEQNLAFALGVDRFASLFRELAAAPQT